MKFSIIVLLILFVSSEVYAGSINRAAYRTMQASSYRQNYRANINNSIIPYWQAQSNFSTRNRVYNNYSHYDNTLQRYNTSVNSARSYR